MFAIYEHLHLERGRIPLESERLVQLSILFVINDGPVFGDVEYVILPPMEKYWFPFGLFVIQRKHQNFTSFSFTNLRSVAFPCLLLHVYVPRAKGQLVWGTDEVVQEEAALIASPSFCY